jgi:hypothetical protein
MYIIWIDNNKDGAEFWIRDEEQCEAGDREIH